MIRIIVQTLSIIYVYSRRYINNKGNRLIEVIELASDKKANNIESSVITL